MVVGQSRIGSGWSLLYSGESLSSSSDFQSHVVLHERDDLAHFEYSFGRNVSTLKKLIATQRSNVKAVEKCRR